jgi:hypothetical protein
MALSSAYDETINRSGFRFRGFNGRRSEKGRGYSLPRGICMPANDFSAWLGKLGRDVSPESDDPVSRTSSTVADAVLSLAAEKAQRGSGGGAWSYYAEAVERPPMSPPSLADLKMQIGKAASIAELRRLRRNFARLGHPDRKAADAPAATRQMQAANELIDQAISSMRRREQR